MNLIELFQSSLGGRSEKRGIRFEGRWYTFGELDRMSDAVAAGLSSCCGISHGDRIAMYLANGPELIAYYLAGLKLGAIVVPVNVLYRDRELTHLLQDCEPRVILCDADRYATFAPLRQQFPGIEEIIVTGDSRTDSVLDFNGLTSDSSLSAFPSATVHDSDPALMLYTSGTTGRSKGAVMTHGNLVSNILALIDCWQWTGRDRFLLTLPLFHIHGLCNGLHGALATGCTTFLYSRFHADQVIRVLEEERCSLFFGVPTMYERLLQETDSESAIPGNMRLYVSGSAPLSPDTFSRFRDTFRHEILERYGMSETAMITSNPYDGPRVQGSVGRPLPGVQVRIADEEGMPVPGPETGEIQVRGPNVLKEYWRQPEMTQEAFQRGWFRTGDLGRFDAEGNLIICGRLKELIICNGFNVYPQEIINCLTEHPHITEAAVIGMPDVVKGEIPKVYVVASSPDLTEAAVRDYCRGQLARFKVPEQVVFLEKLPRNAMGKLQLNELPDQG
jgi:malonyl-CoA/methylmalonyl-CoA synthetase